MWDDAKFVAFDFETSGEKPEYALQPWRVAQGKAWVTSVAIVEKVDGKLAVTGSLGPDRASLLDFLVRCVERGQTVVGWNVQFDIQWLLALGLADLVHRLRFLDGMLLWRHYFIEPEYEMDRGKKKSYGLKSCVAEVLPEHAGYDEDVDFHSTDPAERAKLHRYNVRDTAYTLYLTRHWYLKLAEDPQRLKAAMIEAACIPLVAEANLKGQVVDRFAARELEQHLTNVADRQLAILAPHGVTEKVVRSPVQLATLLFDQWGLPVLKENTGKKTGKVSRATDKEVLHELAFKDERAKELRAYREALNNRTKFATAQLSSIAYNEDGRTRPQAIIFGTYSGRLTYASQQSHEWVDDKGRNRRSTLQIGWALHQAKRAPEYRNTIEAPPGYTIVEFDASGQEFRWMAIASGDETMLNLCLPGEDPHSFMGARIVGRDYRDMIAAVKAKEQAAKDARQLGKVGNLSLQYRTSARKLRVVARVQYELPMELPEAERIHKTYRQAYPGVPLYWDRQIALTKQSGYVETFAGRRVQVTGNWNGDWGWSMGSTSINYRIQGTGADQKYLALSVLRPYLRQIGAYFAWDLHDGIYFYVPDDKVARAVQDIRYLLNNLPYEKAWGFSPPIPLPWDCKTGKTWGSLEEWGE